MEYTRLRSRVRLWSLPSFLMLAAALAMFHLGGPELNLSGHWVGVAQLVWVPSLIGSCVTLWLLLTMSGARGNRSLPLSLAFLAGAEFCALLLPVTEVSGLSWGNGNGLMPAISFAALALTAIIWTATGIVDPALSSRSVYAVAMSAVLIVGFLLSYAFFYMMQGAMVMGPASALLWGASYDRRLRPYGKGTKAGRAPLATLTFVTFLGLPMLLLGLPYLLN